MENHGVLYVTLYTSMYVLKSMTRDSNKKFEVERIKNTIKSQKKNSVDWGNKQEPGKECSYYRKIMNVKRNNVGNKGKQWGSEKTQMTRVMG